MASCSRAFWKPKNAEEERNLIENTIPKSTSAVTKWSVKIFLEWQNGRKNKNLAIESCTFTTDKSKVQRLDSDIAAIYSYKNCAKRMVKGKFTACVPKTSTNITRYLYSIGPVRQVCLLLTNQLAGFPAPIPFRFAHFFHTFPANIREIRPQGRHKTLKCWIINLLLDVLLCSIAENFYSLFVF